MRPRVLPLLLAGAMLLLGLAPAAVPGRARAAERRAPPTPSPSELMAKVDSLIVQFLPTAISWQTTYSATHGGRFFQGLRSHSVIPADGADVAPDQLASHPTDQADTLASFWNGGRLPSKTPFAVTVNVYDGPDGRGFEVVISFVSGGVTYVRVVNVGPESYREQAWAAVQPAA